MTANLQPTTKQLAEAFNVSQRQIYIAKKVRRLRPDLEPQIMAGDMSLNEAHFLATGQPKRKRCCPHCGGEL